MMKVFRKEKRLIAYICSLFLLLVMVMAVVKIQNNTSPVGATADETTTESSTSESSTTRDLPNIALPTVDERKPGPFQFVISGNSFLIKIWFAGNVTQANVANANEKGYTISNKTLKGVIDLEGLENELYIKGKTVATWVSEGAITQINVKNDGRLVFTFNKSMFDYSTSYLIELKNEVKTTLYYVQPFAYWINANVASSTALNLRDVTTGEYNGNGYEYQGKTLEFSRTGFELSSSGDNNLKIWFKDSGTETALIYTNSGDGLTLDVTKLEGLQDALKIDGKTLTEWKTLLGSGFSIGSRSSDGRFTPQFKVSVLNEKGVNFIGKNFTIELANDLVTSQGVVKAFKIVYNWALGQATLNPTCETVAYSEADFFHKMDDSFYFDVKFDKDIITTATTADKPLTGDALQKTDMSSLVKINGHDVATAMTSIQALSGKTDTLRFIVNNAELTHTVKMELSKGYVFPNGNTLADDVTLYYNEGNGKWQTSPMSDITVTYNANGGEGEMNSTTLAYSSELTLAANAFTREHCTFKGWATTADGEVAFNDEATVSLYYGGALSDANSTTLTLYAIWNEPKVKYMSVSTAGDIGLNFYVFLATSEGTHTATFSVEGKEGTSTADGVYDAATDCWKFTYGVAAKDYKDMVTISVAEVNVTAAYSVEKYAEDASKEDKSYPLIQKLIAYCEAARVYFANETATETAELTADLSNYAAKVSKADDGITEGITLKGATLVLESKTAIHIYFTASDVEGLVCKVGEETVEPEKVEGQENLYVVKVENIVAKDLDETYSVTVGGYTVTYSALSYVYAVLSQNNENVALNNVVKALYELNAAANEYFAQ